MSSKGNSGGPTHVYESAFGTIDYPFTNDFIFHAVFEKCETALRAFLCSLLHMRPEEIISVKTMNPIDYGKSIPDKKIILDLKLLLNNNTIVNMEMQIINEKDWPERSVIYLCRSFDNIGKGQTYTSVKSARQISILDFDLFEDSLEFYSTHHLRNDKTGRMYTDRFSLSVLNLKRIEAATEDDKKWQLDKWAAMFKATTWEDLRMIASQSKEMTDASQKVFELNQDDIARVWADIYELSLWEEAMRKKHDKEREQEIERLKSLLRANGIDPDS